jgi:SOS-response transcriptional repressor LexA
MDTSIGTTLSELRKSKKLKQKDIAAKLSGYGFNVKAKTIYNWEKGLAQPSIPHFLALCDILDVDDVLWKFAGLQKGPYAGLNLDGRQKAHEFIELLIQIDKFKASVDVFKEPEEVVEEPRLLRLYDIPVSAGAGNFLENSCYEWIKAPNYVPSTADFALRISGDSMEPLYRDDQVIWVKTQETLNSGDIGIFIYSDDVYCKELVYDGNAIFLRSINSAYEDIEIMEDFGFKTIGKVV